MLHTESRGTWESGGRHIHVRSIAGEFLELVSIFYFENGRKPEIHGGDWMPRSLVQGRIVSL